MRRIERGVSLGSRSGSARIEPHVPCDRSAWVKNLAHGGNTLSSDRVQFQRGLGALAHRDRASRITCPRGSHRFHAMRRHGIDPEVAAWGTCHRCSLRGKKPPGLCLDGARLSDRGTPFSTRWTGGALLNRSGGRHAALREGPNSPFRCSARLPHRHATWLTTPSSTERARPARWTNPAAPPRSWASRRGIPGVHRNPSA